MDVLLLLERFLAQLRLPQEFGRSVPTAAWLNNLITATCYFHPLDFGCEDFELGIARISSIKVRSDRIRLEMTSVHFIEQELLYLEWFAAEQKWYAVYQSGDKLRRKEIILSLAEPPTQH